MATSGKVREPAVAGSFYPGNEEVLRETVTSMLANAQPPRFEGKVIGLVSPHAGYAYSGPVAAHAYRVVQGHKFDAVIIVAPKHQIDFRGSSIYIEGPYKTPLGLVDIDLDLAQAILRSDPSINSRPEAHMLEHSLEVQLPFLQIAVPQLRIVPIIMAEQSMDNCRRLARAISSNVQGKNVLLVASSDLSHYLTQEEAVKMDRVVIDHVEHYDYEGLARDLSASKCQACGGGPVITVMMAAQELGATKGVILKYATSGDATGDYSQVVGYLAAALVSESQVGVDLGLGAQEKEELLRLARASIQAALAGRAIPSMEAEKLDRYPLLKEKRGAFVTLTIDGNLRGCIGHIRGVEPLHSTVAKMAVAAAMEDPRFPRLQSEEFGRVSIEISVLTPLEKISDPERIEVGRDGIFIEKGYHTGLLLPQVATDNGWDRYQFLDQTCRKAGMAPGCWREGADIYIFSAQIFNEEETGGGP
jgi:AmmeMemoRadiSam system protein B/AmmeMemoRadiSam system protein A